MKIRICNNDNININLDISVYNDGAKFSYPNNKAHNIDGPACEFGSGGKTWKFKGNTHRKYGPARKWKGSDEWWFEGVVYSQEEFMEKFL